MKPGKKIRLLKKLLDKSKEVNVEDNSHPAFKKWKKLVEKILVRIFGRDSIEVSEFKHLEFYNNPSISYIGDDQSSKHLRSFRRDFYKVKKLISSSIEKFNTSAHPEPGNN